ncbi:uncharacterized protein TrAFT101_010768 [Trichoderma asperellum]|uniref:uncharacterized protein n=1 Tax=Trichoderma asperellum TaxID=101201 RepID=UPI003320D99E|nr:hypothetical protein TrAFT101_010768 [Trichoderma asperellum]
MSLKAPGDDQTDKEPSDSKSSGPVSDFYNLLNSESSTSRLFMGAVVEAPIPQVSLDNMTEYLVDKTMMSSICDNVTESKFLKNLEDYKFCYANADIRRRKWGSLLGDLEGFT